MNNWCAIVLAGGSGERMGGVNKVLRRVGGRHVISRSAAAFQPLVDRLALVIRPRDREAILAALREDGIDPSRLLLAEGGETRQQSVWNGLCALGGGQRWVMVHDGARCLVSEAVIRGCMNSVEQFGSGVAAVPLTDTVKRAGPEGMVLDTPDRSSLWAVQTPQGFETETLRSAHLRAQADGFEGTDDASLVERLGLPVHLYLSEKRNIKLTQKEDLPVAEALLGGMNLRIGQGYDVHRLTEGRPLILCGERIPWEYGLLGHSDADVAVHALMDALLGALAMGDIGRHFPDSDPTYAGVSSMKLLEHVMVLLRQRGAEVVNVDLTIAAQRPKLAAYIDSMRGRLSRVLGVAADCVSVKATTTEHLGFEGRGEGISAQAVCMIRVPN